MPKVRCSSLTSLLRTPSSHLSFPNKLLLTRSALLNSQSPISELNRFNRVFLSLKQNFVEEMPLQTYAGVTSDNLCLLPMAQVTKMTALMS
jgi:hypothetical protein